MNEYRIEWQAPPFNYTVKYVVFIHAPDADTARRIGRDKIERETGLVSFSMGPHYHLKLSTVDNG